jgi:hypothetical protein
MMLRSGVDGCRLLLPPASAGAQGARTPADATRVLRINAALPWLALPPAIVLQDSGLAGGARGRLIPAGSCFVSAVPVLLFTVAAVLLERAMDAAVWLQ